MRLPRLLHVLAVLAAVLLFAEPRIAAGCECDSPYVRHHGNVRHHDSVIGVYPTHHDDTANLRCALAVASREPGHTIELAAGQFWTRQLWAQNFIGTLKGQGADKTILSNRGPLKVTDDSIMSPPSASNLWPSFLTFVDGDFTVSDLGIRMIGPQVTAPYNALGGTFENVIFGEVVITGSHADASFERLAVEGATVNEGYGKPYDDVVSMFFQPVLGAWAPEHPMSGRFRVAGCTFRNVAMAFNAGVVEHAQMTWHANTIVDSGAGFEIWDAVHAVVEANRNHVQDATGLGIGYPAIAVGGSSFTGLGLQDTTVVLTDNEVSGIADQWGLWVVPWETDTLRTIAVGNAFSGTTGIYLGPNTKGSIVKAEGVPVVNEGGSANYVLLP